jgi:predicted unusual protein kinase regulating ubiquinone biosynthesis (AarF/ABC1/UbiB family)
VGVTVLVYNIPFYILGFFNTMTTNPKTPASKMVDTLSGGARFAKMSTLSALRLGKTMRVVYPQAASWLFRRRRPDAMEVRQTFEELGVTYIKLGQLIASSPSLFPKDYVEAFEGCLDQVSPISFSKVMKVIKSELGDIKKIFSYIDPKPLASASIAQVHAATLITGEDVVIKVQKPGVESLLSTDMNFLFVMSRLVEMLSPGLSKESVSDMVAELYQSMVDECDFLKEADNLDSFKLFLQEQAITDVIAPKPYRQASSKRVLTMERFYGVPLTDYDTLLKYNKDPASVLITGMNTWFTSLMKCDFFHADLHSGNIMLLEDGRLGFIDFGMVDRIQPKVWEGLFSLMAGISNGSYRDIAVAMVDVGMTSKTVDVDVLCADIENLLGRQDDFDLSYTAGMGDDINKQLVELAELAKAHGIRFPRAFTLLLKQFLYFDRYIQLLVPDMDIFNDDRIRF